MTTSEILLRCLSKGLCAFIQSCVILSPKGCKSKMQTYGILFPSSCISPSSVPSRAKPGLVFWSPHISHCSLSLSLCFWITCQLVVLRPTPCNRTPSENGAIPLPCAYPPPGVSDWLWGRMHPPPPRVGYAKTLAPKVPGNFLSFFKAFYWKSAPNLE